MSDAADNVVRTVFDWDIDGVLGGIREIEKAYDREKNARKKGKEGAHADNKKEGGHGMGDLGLGVHDLLMGRGQAALSRFSSGLKVAGYYATGMGIALEAGGKALEYVARKTEEADAAAARLEQSFLRVSKAATFTSSANGPQSIMGVVTQADEQAKGEKDLLNDLATQRDLENQKFGTAGVKTPWLGSFGGGFYKAYDHIGSWLTGSLTIEEKIAQAQQRMGGAVGVAARARGQFSAALGDQRDDLFDKAYGNPYAGQRHVLDRQQTSEIEAARSAGLGGKANEKAIKDRYDTQRVLLAREEKNAYRRLETETKISRLRMGGTDYELRGAKLRLTESYQAMNDQTPGSFARAQAQGEYFQRGAEVKQLEHSREQEVGASNGQTAAMRLKTLGRDDQAAVVESRAQSATAIADARFHGKNGIADNLEEQARQQQRQFLVTKYLNQDGTRRNPGDVLREEIQRQRKATRIETFFGGTKDTDAGGGLHTNDDGRLGGVETAASRRLAQAHGPMFTGTALSRGAQKLGPMSGVVRAEHGMDGEITGGFDALTGAHLNAQQVHEHAAEAMKTAAYHAANAKDDRSDREIQQDIYKVLEARLPKISK